MNEERFVCEICGKKCTTKQGLSLHISRGHKINLKKYYDKYIKSEGEEFCITCKKPVKYYGGLNGYAVHCCHRCASLDPEVQKKSQNTCIEKYGVKYSFQSENNITKSKQTKLERYGDETYTNPDKRKKTNLEKFGVDNPLKSTEIQKKIKQTNRKRYNADWYISSESYKHNIDWELATKKQFETKKKNGTLNTSKLEQKAIEDIKNMFPEAIASYNADKRYPWHCDLYIPSLDLFIEFNFHWTHGGHWFNETDENDISRLSYAKERSKKSKYYKKFIDIWTTFDVNKRLKAKEHELNYIVFWRYDDIKLWEALGCPISKDWREIYSWLPHKQLNNKLRWSKLTVGCKTCNSIVKKAQFEEFYKRELNLWNSNPWSKSSGHLHPFIYTNRLKHINKTPNQLSDLEILRGLNISGKIRAYSTFDNTGMKQFIEKYNIHSIYDPCAGWGERLVTCAALKIKYFGIDINPKVVEGHKKIIEHYNLDNQNTILGDSSTYINTEKYDSTFTCPPYWNTEIYTKDGAENLDYDEFLNWWKQVIINANTDIFAYQINQKYKDDMNRVLVDLGYTFVEEIIIPKKSSHFTRKRGGIDNKTEYESIQVFKIVSSKRLLSISRYIL